MSATATGNGAPAQGGPSRPALRWALAALCLTQIVSWGVLYYAFPVMLESITVESGWSTAAVTGAFSAGLGVCALAGIPVGRLLDRFGPGPVMSTGSVVGVGAVAGVATASDPGWFTAAWLAAGLAQAALFYPAAFAALTRWYWPDHVRAITVLTLVAGLSSTIFAPLTAGLLQHLSWRAAYLVLAAVLAVATLPAHALLTRVPWPPSPHRGRPSGPGRNRAGPGRVAGYRRAPVVTSRGFLLLAAAFGIAAFGLFAGIIYLVPLLTERGLSTTAAAWALGLSGAGQLLGRLGYPWLVRRTGVRARTVGVLLAAGGTTAAVALVAGPIAAVILVAVLAGAARGLFTLLSATAVSDRWGAHRFGTRNGVFQAPTTAAMAMAPVTGAVVAAAVGGYPAMFLVLAAGMVVAAGLSLAAGPRS